MNKMMEAKIININKNNSQIGNTLNLMPKAFRKSIKTTLTVLHSETLCLTKTQDMEDGPMINELNK